MGSCSSISESKIAVPSRKRKTDHSSRDVITSYPSIEDVLKSQKLKKKKTRSIERA